MLERLWRLFGIATDSEPPRAHYDPIYGLPRRAVEEWLARNPRLRDQYKVQKLASPQSPAPGGVCGRHAAK
jgi:hypothetical protein